MIQKIYSTTAFLCITVRFRGSTKYLYLGRGSGFEGLWPGSKAPPAAMRARDRFLEYLRKHLTSNYLRGLDADPFDRILSLKFGRGNAEGTLMLFWSGRQLYFLNYFLEEGKRKLFLSWSGYEDATDLSDNSHMTEEARDEALKEYFFPLGRKKAGPAPAEGERQTEAEGDSPVTIESVLQGEEDRLGLKGEKEKRKQIKFMERKRLRIEEDLKKNEGWRLLEALVNDHEKPLDLMSAEEMKLGTVVFKFNKHWNSYRRLDAVYEKIKKLRRGEGIQRKRWEEVVKAVMEERDSAQKAPEASLKVISPVWYNPKDSRKVVKGGKGQGGATNQAEVSEHDMWVADLGGGIRAGIGKSGRGNDFLRNSWGSKEHLWFHLEGYTGSHCVVRVVALAELTERQLGLIGSILRDQSNTSLLTIPLVYTQLKNVKGVKGSSGKVTLKKEKYYSVEYIESWRPEILGH